MTVVNYRSNNVELDDTLRALCERKLQTLEKFFQNHPETEVEVEFRREGQSNTGKQYKVSALVIFSGKTFYAASIEESFERALDEVRDELDKELRRSHDKQVSLVRRGGAALKRLLRFGGR